MVDEPKQISAVHRGVTKAGSVPVPVRVQASAADLQHRTGLALCRQGGGPDLPGDGGGVTEGVVEAVRSDMQPGVGSARVAGTERVEFLDGAIGVHHHQGARQQPKALDGTRLAEDELDKLAEQPDARFLARGTVPALEHADQPVGVAGAWRRFIPVGVRQQQVNRGRLERQQRLIHGDRVVADVDRAEYAAVAVTKLRGREKVQRAGDIVEAVAAIRVAAMPPRRVGVAVEADAYADPGALEDFKHRATQQSAIGLHGHVHPRRHLVAQRCGQFCQPFGACQERFTAVQDYVDARKVMPAGMLGYALHSRPRDGRAHPLWEPAPRLIRHLIHITI